jgi:hypothetical protein
MLVITGKYRNVVMYVYIVILLASRLCHVLNKTTSLLLFLDERFLFVISGFAGHFPFLSRFE